MSGVRVPYRPCYSPDLLNVRVALVDDDAEGLSAIITLGRLR